jgi:hypothetical protein
VALIALVAVAPVQAAGTASPYGTRLGTPKYRHQQGPNDPIKLLAGPVWVQVDSTGRTGVGHDAPSGTSTCTTRYSSALSSDGWRIYVQQGKPKISGNIAGGPPTEGICGSSPCCASRDAVRLRVAGAKLRVEFGSVNPARKATAPQDFDPDSYKSGYLHR